jgi:hypothetical protein
MLNGHIAVISHDIDGAFLNPPRREIPVTGKADIGFRNLFPVHKKLSIDEPDLLPLKSNHPLEKHHASAGEADCHNIVPLGLREKIGRPPAEIEPSVMVGRLHAGALDVEGNAHITKEKKRNDPNAYDPYEISGRDGRKEKSADPLMKNHASRRRPPTDVLSINT